MELFDKLSQGEALIERAILVQIDFGRSANKSQEMQDEHEFKELVRSAGARDSTLIVGSRKSPDPKFFVGSGKAEEIKTAVIQHDADVVIFDHALSPAQERNIEKLVECRVLDRTALILDIFAQRAKSHEGKLQVELAQLKHMSTRLVRGWTHLERQKGGIGMRGPGETQLETDRRLLNVRIKQINKRLEKVSKQREQGRQLRQKTEIPTVSLVGYTNAGKSTLFNKITGSKVYAANLLFATLDPTLRRVNLPDQQAIILADTVGFIRDLPHDLVAAFRATLQETIEADLILHVIDSSDEQRDFYREEVNKVIRALGAEDVPQLEVMNKIDLTEQPVHYDEAHEGLPARVWLSAVTGEGISELLEKLSDVFAKNVFKGHLKLHPALGRLRAQLYEDEAIVEESISEKGEYLLEVCIQQRRLETILAKEELTIEQLQ
ncbi:MAG: GTPase HflX [Cocleimonas sp.]|nr:GTPase HflX [Cocleimonas sp.]